jgi:flagellar biosynthesis protein FlhB
MAETSSEKQHLPSSKRIADLRQQGQTMRSRDLTSGVVFLSGIAALTSMAVQFKQIMTQNFIRSFSDFKPLINNHDFPAGVIATLAKNTMELLLPLLVIIFVSTFLSPFIFGGWNFTLEAVRFKADKLNPINYFKKIFSMNIFVEILRSMMKVVFIMLFLVYYAMQKKDVIAGLTHLPPKTSIIATFHLITQFIGIISALLIFIIAIDVVYHYYEFQNRVKMTTQELKDEHKESDGNPEIKRKIRATQFAMLKQRLSISVPQANVIVTNPTHYAIALRYDDRIDKAPKILAKGKDHQAMQIRQLAIANGIPIYEAPPLARAIYHTGNIGGEVHPGLYMAVAIVLSYVMQLKNYQIGGGQMPLHQNDLQIPEELIYNE